MAEVSQDQIHDAQKLRVGLRVEVDGKPGEIVAPHDTQKISSYVPIYLVAFDGDDAGYYPCWWDELQVVE
jgi:hypothetical protein